MVHQDPEEVTITDTHVVVGLADVVDVFVTEVEALGFADVVGDEEPP